ncbi:MAG: YdcF family protein [Pseudomonadota bacterium]
MRFVAKLILLIGLLFFGGFFVFVASLPRASQFDIQMAKADMAPLAVEDVGIAALTGGRGSRIDRAFALYEEGVADRVLISGTHPQVTKSDLANRTSPETMECCVDLGPRAQTTIGNAIETRDWVRKQGYQGLYLVTSDYHLPRATLELKGVTEGLMIVGVPVENTQVPEARWYQSPQAWNVLAREYIKFLLTAVRTLI